MTTKRQRLHRLENRADRFERLVQRSLRRAIKAGTKDLGAVAAAALPAEPYVSLDDLNAIETAWQAELRAVILPELGRTLIDGAHDAIEDLVTRAPVLLDGRHPAAELYLSQAEMRLQHVGADVWQHTRNQLVLGMAEGESIPELSKRVRSELVSSSVRATTIARTEVVSASNAGALQQMLAMGADGPAEKVWLSTSDGRTRESHRLANGQSVAIEEPFAVGGVSLNFPGDPRAPVDEVVNCRCTLTWNIEPSVQVAAGWEKFPVKHDPKSGRFMPGSGDNARVINGDASAVHDRGQEFFDATATQEQKNARLFYMGGVGYDNINGGLRGTRSSVDDQTKQQISHLDDAFASASVTSTNAITVHRGVNRWSGLDTSKGSELVDGGFVSTSSNDWAFNQGNVVLRIRVPAGTKMLPADERWGELMLNRGTRIRFTDDKPEIGPFGKEIYNVEVVS